MTRRIVVLLTIAVVLLGSAGVSAQKTIKVGATPVPHADILNLLVPVLAEQGVNLVVIEFTDYVLPNLTLAEGEIDANFFQHTPYLDRFNKDHNLNLVPLAGVHIEPLGVYSNKIKSLDDLPQGATIAIPGDAVNGG
ncbi:MAG: MetQ/NlpA family ABC transporter substrate-binding protein, partial [Limnochordia bacterium]